MIKNVYEILKEVADAATHEEKKTVLQKNNLHHIRCVLEYTFNDKYQYYPNTFPLGYIKPDTLPGIRIAGLESEIRKHYLFLIGDPTADILTVEKRNILLLQLLESFEPEEAIVFINMMNKDLKIPGLTKQLVSEVYPEIL